MAKSSKQKIKLLCIYRMLLEKSDEEHPVTIQEMITELNRYGITAERKSIYDDLEALKTFGLDIQSRKGHSPGWFIGSRDFELPELKLLMDAVQSSRFITQRKSDALIHKLETLASAPQARQLQRQVFVTGRVKVMNESIYYNVDKLHSAISGRRSITFRYFDYGIHREKVYHRDGDRYAVSPFGLIWNNENYYLVAFDHTHQHIRHYRVDKMDDLLVTSLPQMGRDQYPDFNLAEYGEKHFGMYSGPELTVTLRGRRSMAGVVWDRFGQGVILTPDGPDHFTVQLPVILSPQFFGWLFGLNNGLQLVAPASAVSAYRTQLMKALGPQRVL